jgi:hypothetical protein
MASLLLRMGQTSVRLISVDPRQFCRGIHYLPNELKSGLRGISHYLDVLGVAPSFLNVLYSFRDTISKSGFLVRYQFFFPSTIPATSEYVIFVFHLGGEGCSKLDCTLYGKCHCIILYSPSLNIHRNK